MAFQADVSLSDGEFRHLINYIKHPASCLSSVLRAKALLLLDEKQKLGTVMQQTGLSRATVFNIRKRYRAGGLASIITLPGELMHYSRHRSLARLEVGEDLEADPSKGMPAMLSVDDELGVLLLAKLKSLPGSFFSHQEFDVRIDTSGIMSGEFRNFSDTLITMSNSFEYMTFKCLFEKAGQESMYVYRDVHPSNVLKKEIFAFVSGAHQAFRVSFFGD